MSHSISKWWTADRLWAPSLNLARQPPPHRRQHRLVHGIDVAGGVDHHAALRLARGDVEKALAELLVEGAVLALEARLRPGARGGAGEAEVDGQVEDQRQVRGEGAGDDAMQRLEIGTRHA